MEMIKTVDLHKSFGDLHVLTGVNETIQKGEVVSIIGPSGGGKSTFLRCLNLLEKDRFSLKAKKLPERM